MEYSHPGTLGMFAGEVKRSRYRGLVLLHGRSLQDLLDSSVEVLGGECIVVAPGWVRAPRGCRAGSPGGFERLLGLGADYVFIVTDGLLRPNLVAGLAGVVRSGGLLVVIAPPLDGWSPGPRGGLGGYKRYLLASLEEAGVLLWADADSGVVYRYRAPGSIAQEWRLGSRGYRARYAPGRLARLTATPSQAAALDAFAHCLGSGCRGFLVTGDRGRGKSYLLGLSTALAARRGVAGEVVVTAPSPASLSSFYRGLVQGLRVLGLRFRVRKLGGEIVSVTGPWGRVAYSAPDEAEPAGLLVVDEAAAVGVARLRRLAWKSGRVLAATTLHGYEGAGRVFQHMVEEVLPKPLRIVELREPVRYPPGDPLEEWVNEVFVLRPDPGPVPGRIGNCGIDVIDPVELAGKPSEARSIVRLLALAHYRTEPDYLLVVLESRNHVVHVARCGGSIVAVADTALEEWGLEEPARIGLKTLWLQVGDEARGLRLVRIVRIAVHPSLQRRGLGSRLLRWVEDWARGRADLVAAIFGRHDVIGFWVRLGYQLYYISPRYNRATGEKNLGFAKPLTMHGERILAKASARARRKLILGSHIVYRDLAAEKAAILLKSSTPSQPGVIRLGEADLEALRKYLDGVLELEQVVDSAYLVAVRALLAGCEKRLDEQGLVAVMARILQGKTLGETAEILGAELEEAKKLLRSAISSLIAGCMAGAGT